MNLQAAARMTSRVSQSDLVRRLVVHKAEVVPSFVEFRSRILFRDVSDALGFLFRRWETRGF
jgi:hypothetical protein